MLTFCIFLLAQTTFAASAVMFYHEPSYIVLKPIDNIIKTSDFGFTMGHQKQENRLVVGAPHADKVGRVYGCHIAREPKNSACEQLDIDVERLTRDYYQVDTTQKLCLGATIATTSKYFLTCAPLWTTSLKRVQEVNPGSYGTCFVYYNKTNVHRIQGMAEQRQNVENKNEDYPSLYGGIGWSSLADEKNEVLLIGKPYDAGDIQYINSTDLELDEGRRSRSLIVSDKNYDYFNRRGLAQIGYALAAGRFFSEETTYAFSIIREKNIHNRVLFLTYDKQNNVMNVYQKDNMKLESKVVGDMYGSSMHSADINADNMTDLLIGAPAHSILGGCETGALYIYTGGKLKNFRRIVSDKARSRFGTAIATSDLDGDSKPEIFVSAPYEDFGIGALYILSGDEVINAKTIDNTLKLKNLKWTQRIQKQEFRSFGFSLQVVSNINDNGCDGLAVGSPQNASVILLRCVPAIDAFLSIDILNQVLKSTDTSFTVEVCVRVIYYTKSETITTKLQVTNTVYGKGATLVKDKFVIDLADKNDKFCENITVALRPDERDLYHFMSTLGYLNEEQFDRKEFDSSWVRFSKYSRLMDSKMIDRACKGDDCTPNLDMEILWGRSNNISEFYVEEKTNETVTLLVKNFGANAYKACVSITVIGAEEHIHCQAIEEKDKFITCGLPSPVARNSTHALSFVVDINKVINVNDAVHIKAKLYADCLQSDVILKELEVKFIFAVKKVYIIDGSHTVTVTETQIKNGTNSTLVDKHEYKIINNGGLVWENVAAILHIPKKSFIQNYSVFLNHEGSTCVENDTVESVEFLCTGMQLHNVPIVIHLTTNIPYVNITENLEVDSSIEVRMASSNNTLNFLKKNQTTTIKFVKDEVAIGNNKTAVLIIVILIALIILVVVAAILYKVGFFERKELSRLDSFKASIKSKHRSESEMPSTSGAGDSKTNSKENSMEDFDIEVVDDCPFEVQLPTDDEAALIVEDKTEPSTSKSRTKSTSSQSVKGENKRKASSASHTNNSSTKQGADIRNS